MSGDNKRSNDSDRSLPAFTRRRMLLSAAVGGTSLLAGCGGDSGDGDGDGDGTPTPTEGEETVPGQQDLGGTDTATATATDEPADLVEDMDLAHVSDQEFRLPMYSPPENISFFSGRWGMGASATVDVGSELDEVPVAVQQAMWEPEVIGRWNNTAYWNAPGEGPFYRLFENIEFLDDGIRCTLRDDAYWSDGEPITAYDCAAFAVGWNFGGMSGREWPVAVEDANPWHALDDVSMPDGSDGKVYKLEDPRGLQNKYTDAAMLDWGITRRLGHGAPTHVEPMKSLAEAFMENLQSAKEGGDWKAKNKIIQDIVTADHIEAWRDPENVVTSGAWALDEIRGSSEVVLKPNEHWRHADRINFDKVVFEYAENEQRQRAAIQADSLDYGWGETPPDVVEGFPDNVKQNTTPSSAGGGLGFNHAHRAFGDRRVRKAIMYSLDTEAIASNVHPDATAAITTPGGDMWARDAVLSDEWVDQNLIEYSTDVEQANTLMEEAGWTTDDGTWHKDGEPLEVQLPAVSESPVFETTVANQLQNFGIDIQVQTYDSATYQDRWDNGEFDIWTIPWMTGFYNDAWDFWWHCCNSEWEMRTRNLYPEEDQEKAMEGYADSGWVAGQWGLWEDLTIEIPPVGKPDGELQEFAPSYMNGYTQRGPGTLDEELIKKFIWTANWYIPTVPVYRRENQHFMDEGHWHWEQNHYMWDYFDVSIDTSRFLSMNWIRADPEDPEEGATVEE